MRAWNRWALLGGGLAVLLLAGCNRVLPAETRHPPREGVQVQMREVDPDGRATLQWQGRSIAVKAPPILTSADIVDVRAALDAAHQPVLELTFRKESAGRLLHATEALVGKRVALTVDDHVLSVATIAGPFGESMQVAGTNMSVAEVHDMARYIVHGGPAPPQQR
ncbi:hypothetical protein TEP_00955 [Stenotrophomonas sp. TEPEL]|uniref:SecDF P1 head subdomain-containing protein n=1 Tax=Stenotrophomonas sp. TEPEL TaxID=2283801 RepID=UPI00104425DA|nr:hypothetical protein [Stenotrophomonas sp. TEPEL]TDB32340.1 hypothetical protein TEP_00955 [Stenotrophomonas sp. TEPEL]